jgi:hypothetical protein
MLRRSLLSSGQQALRSFKPKIQATKPKDTSKMVADGVVVRHPFAFVHGTCTCSVMRLRQAAVDTPEARRPPPPPPLTPSLQIVASLGAIAEIMLRLKAKVRLCAALSLTAALCCSAPGPLQLLTSRRGEQNAE